MLVIDDKKRRFRVMTGALCLGFAMLTTQAALQPLRAQPSPVPSQKQASRRKQGSGRAVIYLPSRAPDCHIYRFRASAQGTLTALEPPVFVPHDPYRFAVSPNGRFLYVNSVNRDDSSSTLLQYRIGLDGRLDSLSSAALSAPMAEDLTVTPNGRFLFLAHPGPIVPNEHGPNIPDMLLVYRIAQDGTLHRTRNKPINPGPQPFSLAVDATGQFLYVGIYNLDNSGNRAYLRQYRIHADGRLTPLEPPTLGEGVGSSASQLLADPVKPLVYLSNSDGLSCYRIGSDGALRLLQREDSGLSVAFFVLDASADLLFGATFDNELVVWHRNPDGTLQEPTARYLADDGFLYVNQADIPRVRQAPGEGKPQNARSHGGFPGGIAFDTEQQQLIVYEAMTGRLLRYQVQPEGSLHLRAPWFSTKARSIDNFKGNHLLVVRPQ